MDSATFNVFAKRMALAEVTTIRGVMNYMKDFAPNVRMDEMYAAAFLDRIRTYRKAQEDK